MLLRRFGLALGLLLAFATTSPAATIRVPADQPTIQAGIDAASELDTVLVAPGTYWGPGNRDLHFDGQNRIIVSEQGAGATTIDAALGQGGLPGRVFNLLMVGAATTIAGFTIQGGDSRTLSLNGAGGGALLVVSAPTFRDCVFRSNRAENRTNGGGGAVACISSSARFEDCTFLDNVVQGQQAAGGAVACYAPSTPMFLRCHFENNQVFYLHQIHSAAAGALLAMDHADPLIEECTFTGNTSDTIAGAIFTGYFTVVTIRRCIFRENVAHNGGAGILQGSVSVEDCEFIANSARFGGGLELSAGPSMVVRRCLFTGNSAADEGGGCRAANGEQRIEECVFTGNESAFGGALQLYDTMATVDHCTMAGNSSGIMVGRDGNSIPSYLTVSNSIISSSTEGAAIRCSAVSSAVVSCTDIFANAGGDWDDCIAGQGGANGNFSLDPDFCEPEVGDFALAPASPCAPAHSPPGCGLIGALAVGCATDVAAGEAPPAMDQLVVSPNPVRWAAEFALAGAGPRILEIYDAQGRLVDRLTGSGGRWVWTPGTAVPAGVYFARLGGDGSAPGAIKFLRLR